VWDCGLIELKAGGMVHKLHMSIFNRCSIIILQICFQRRFVTEGGGVLRLNCPVFSRPY